MRPPGVLEAVVAAGLWGRAVKKGRFSCIRLHGLFAPYPRRCLEDNHTLCISAVMRCAYRECLESLRVSLLNLCPLTSLSR